MLFATNFKCCKISTFWSFGIFFYNNYVQLQKVSIPTSKKVIKNFDGDGVPKAKTLKKDELNSSQKKCSGRINIFYNTIFNLIEVCVFKGQIYKV